MTAKGEEFVKKEDVWVLHLLTSLVQKTLSVPQVIVALWILSHLWVTNTVVSAAVLQTAPQTLNALVEGVFVKWNMKNPAVKQVTAKP